jgi:hypothetical protein
MRAIRNVNITCPKCGHVFPAPLKFGALPELLRALRLGFPAQCSSCYYLFEVKRSHVSVELAPNGDDTA